MEQYSNNFFLYNDEIKNKEESLEDTSYNGKSIYEVIRIIDGKPLFLEPHLRRMENSCKITGLRIWLTGDEIKNRIKKLVEVNKAYIGNIKIIFNFSRENVFMAYFSKYFYPPLKYYKTGVDTIFFHGEREDPNAKVINAAFREKVNEKIKENNVFEAILVDNKGNITEGSKSNIFMIKGEKVITAPVGDVLPGVTRDVIIKICKDMGFEVMEEKINYKQIEKLDALFISGTSPKVLPVKRVENIDFHSPENKVLMSIMNAYDHEMEKDIKSFTYSEI
ncbi:aminotransferase class IV [Clostridium kluyveri]|uniref:aminotransferase class IV n=1 Tax=Clostridium kluyveri TaxID=1534 RepID=UPI002247F0CE|nr:aminotransferase class IV [Clostridium kluyveri]UZQ50495.1 aminotransferase class IV [Clostridium kluyveri]